MQTNVEGLLEEKKAQHEKEEPIRLAKGDCLQTTQDELRDSILETPWRSRQVILGYQTRLLSSC